MASRKTVLRYLAPIRLARLVDRPGGRDRQIAIAEAEQRVEEMRTHFMSVLSDLLENLARISLDRSLPLAHRLACMDSLTDQVITMAGTYRLNALRQAGEYLCDLLAADVTRAGNAQNAIDVCINALRLFSPATGAGPDAGATANVLSELRLVLAHLGVARNDNAPAGETKAGA